MDCLEKQVKLLMHRKVGVEGETEIITEEMRIPKDLIGVYARALKGLANPTRLVVLFKIAEQGSYNSELSKLVGLAPGPLSFHLAVLRSGGLISQEFVRGRYVITDLGRDTLSLILNLTEQLTQYQTVELDRYCWRCSEKKMKVDIYSGFFRAWCPACGGDHGEKWCDSGVNPYGDDWRHKDLDDFLDEGFNLAAEILEQSISESKCLNCGSKVEWKRSQDQTMISSTCPVCGVHNGKGFNSPTPDVFLPLWRKYKKITVRHEGPLEKDRNRCWKITISTPNHEKIVQYRDTTTGSLIQFEEDTPGEDEENQ